MKQPLDILISPEQGFLSDPSGYEVFVLSCIQSKEVARRSPMPKFVIRTCEIYMPAITIIPHPFPDIVHRAFTGAADLLHAGGPRRQCVQTAFGHRLPFLTGRRQLPLVERLRGFRPARPRPDPDRADAGWPHLPVDSADGHGRLAGIARESCPSTLLAIAGPAPKPRCQAANIIINLSIRFYKGEE